MESPINGLSKIINKFSIIKQIPIFNNLNWFQLHMISQKSVLQEYHKGDFIYKEESPADGFYCLISGRLQAYNMKSSGRKDNLELILRGTHFGITSLFTGENHSLTVEAVNDSIILKITRDDFLLLLKMIPKLAIELNRSLSQRVRNKKLNAQSIFNSSIISVYSPVKGTGSSTYALNLAINLERETKRKVILVNISSNLSDEQSLIFKVPDASPHWKIPGIRIQETVGDHQKIIQSVIKGHLNVDLLHVVFNPTNKNLVDLISQFVSALINDYYYLVVDLPNNMDDVVLQTLTQSDLIHLITLNRMEDLKLTNQVIHDLQTKLKDRFIKENVQVMISSLDRSENRLVHHEIDNVLDFKVSDVLPFIPPEDLRNPVITDAIAVITPGLDSEYTKTLARISRKIGGILIGLVLGGGAALGLAHIGVIKVLERENIPIDIVVGSSMGALIAALWTIGNNSEHLEIFAREFEKKQNGLKLFDPVFPRTGFIGGRLIKLWLKKHLGDKTFYDTKVSLKIVSYDLIRREEQILDQGSLVDAVRESVAIPGVIEPVFRGGKMIIDGGVLNPLPTNVLTTLGIKKIIAINVLQSPADVSKGYDLHQEKAQLEHQIPFMKSPLVFLGVRISKVFSANIPDIIIRTLQASEYVIAEQSANQADVLIHPNLVGINWFELYQVDQLIQSGEDATLQKIGEIKRLIRE